MGRVIPVACVFHLYSLAPHAAQQPAAITVGVNVTFNRAATSSRMMLRVKDEAQAIWSPYGVAFRWPDDRSGGITLHLDAIVDRGGADHDDDAHSQLELGHTTLDCSGIARGPIRISMRAIERSVGAMLPLEPALRDRQLAIAIGRVLAHEIGHALLGAPAYHDAEGLMRSSFRSVDLARFDRRNFMLSARSVGRLRARVATFQSGAHGDGGGRDAVDRADLADEAQ
jgi:hypothetical protein